MTSLRTAAIRFFAFRLSSVGILMLGLSVFVLAGCPEDGTVDPTSVTVVASPSDGLVSVDPVTGEITYTPDVDFGGTDSFAYEVCDTDGACDTATVSVTVNAVNDPPVYVPDVDSFGDHTPGT